MLYSASTCAHVRLAVSVARTAIPDTSTLTPAAGLEITVNTIFPGDAGEVMVTIPAFGSQLPAAGHDGRRDGHDDLTAPLR